MTRSPDTTRRALRIGLAIVALPAAWIAVWALVAPHGFYTGFPGGGRHWVAPLGAYDEHLVRDVGAFELGLFTVALFAFVTLERRLVQAALVAFAVSGLPHLVYHATATGPLSTANNVLSLAGLTLGVVLPLALLPLTARRRLPA